MHSLQNGVERWYLARLETHRGEPCSTSLDAAFAQLRERRAQLADRGRRAARPRSAVRRAEKRVAGSE